MTTTVLVMYLQKLSVCKASLLSPDELVLSIIIMTAEVHTLTQKVLFQLQPIDQLAWCIGCSYVWYKTSMVVGPDLP